MKEDNKNVTAEKEEVMFTQNTTAVINNEVRSFKKNSKHKFEKKIAKKLVSQNVAEYVKTKKDNKDTNNTETEES